MTPCDAANLNQQIARHLTSPLRDESLAELVVDGDSMFNENGGKLDDGSIAKTANSSLNLDK